MRELSLPLDIESLEILSQQIDKQGNIIIEVSSKCTNTTCHKCDKPATRRYGHAPVIRVQHTSILDKPVYLEIKPVRYQCENCGSTTTEQYDWCSRNAKVTHALEDYLMRSLIHSTVQDVSRKEGISYKVIEGVISRRVNSKVDWSNFKSLDVIGIDEIALKKGHNDYFTIISSRSTDGGLRIIGVINGRSYDEVKPFLDSIPKHLKDTVTSVCSDMHDGFINAATEAFGSRILVVDRYHVANLYRKSLDKLRISEMSRLKSELPEEEYKNLKGMMWILRKKHECLSKEDKAKLQSLYRYAPKLKEAHKYALKLTQIFNTYSTRKSGIAKLQRWISSVEKNDVSCFKTFIKTLKKYLPYISNYFKARQTSGFVEGLNNKIKVAKRRCYGLFKTETLFQRLHLDLCGFELFA